MLDNIRLILRVRDFKLRWSTYADIFTGMQCVIDVLRAIFDFRDEILPTTMILTVVDEAASNFK